MGFRIRILLGMFALIVLSLVGTALVAYRFDQEQQDVYNKLRLQRKEAAVERSLEYAFNNYSGSWSDEVIPALFSDRICELSDIHGLSISLYNPEGKLLISSLFGAPSDSTALLQVPSDVMTDLQSQTESEGEDIDYGDYIMAYWNFRDHDGAVVTIANVRYDKRQMEASGFLPFVANLAPLYIALFFGAGLLAVFLTNNIVRPLTALRQRLSELDLTASQDPIHYEGQDAIGDLVKQYNTLLVALKEKVDELAKSEREGAWRSMAMQVAHEIKNPLTPLKLGVQQLERAVREGRPDLAQRVERFAPMAIAQIDVLTAVASDFSQMASIDPDRFERVDLREVLTVSANLYDPHGVVAHLPEGEFMVRGTRKHLLRVFNNLLSNAVQAVEEKGTGTVRIIAERAGQGCLVRVVDEGVGIASERLDRIFEPRFTTKSSGTGLGLSMAQMLVNHFGGLIEVASEQGVGTTFSVWLPTALE
jgi:signal transduction histidine kinase